MTDRAAIFLGHTLQHVVRRKEDIDETRHKLTRRGFFISRVDYNKTIDLWVISAWKIEPTWDRDLGPDRQKRMQQVMCNQGSAHVSDLGPVQPTEYGN